MFLNLLQVTAGAGIDYVVDINPRKQGHFVPIMRQRIVGPDWLLRNPPDLVIVMNPEYEFRFNACSTISGSAARSKRLTVLQASSS